MRWSSSSGSGNVGGIQQTEVGERERPVGAVLRLGRNLVSRVSKSNGLAGGELGVPDGATLGVGVGTTLGTTVGDTWGA
jgi:hypothetical protein